MSNALPFAALVLAAACSGAPPREPAAVPAPEPVAAAGETRRDPWEEARQRGIEFRAVGQEPGWFLEIDQQREMRLLYDYAEREARAPAPPPVAAGETTTWDAGRLRAVSVERPCQDGMSGESFPRRVIVTVDGRELQGCGRPLTPP